MTETKSIVTKQKAATCQLETAIKLFLENRDLISAYTLCCAADSIIQGIYKNDRVRILSRQKERSPDLRSFRFSWREEWEIRLKPEYQKEGFRLINEAQNFFKHADKDHEDTYEFNGWELSGLRIFFAITDYNLVFGEMTKAMNVFFVWYAIQHPRVLGEGNPLLTIIKENPDCRDLATKYTIEEMAEIGCTNLMSACPDLFYCRDSSSNVQTG